MNYGVTFTRHSYFEVDAKSEEEAYDKAYKQFYHECHSPIGSAHYDEYEIECLDEEDDDE